MSISFAQLEKIICTKGVEAAIKYLMDEYSMGRKEAEEFIKNCMHRSGM